MTKRFIKLLAPFALVSIFAAWIVPDPITIHLIGDSTMADKPLIDNPEHGWGQMFPLYFSNRVKIQNHARNGRSTKSFINQGLWEKVYNQLKPGEYLFIQFGHNDSKVEDTARYASPQGDYKTNLLFFIRKAREKQAIPILLTPVNRRGFDSKGAFVDKHGEYPDVVREVARQERVPLIDLHQRSKDLLVKVGPEKSKELFLWIKPNEYAALPQGKEDNTHFTRIGALTIAGLAADGVRDLPLPLAAELVKSPPSLAAQHKVVVGLDYYFNCEFREKKPGVREQFHYTWEDTTNSGFSELGRTIDRLGGDLDTLRSAPTADNLKRFQIYIIVDPDTPAETQVPNYILPEHSAAIVDWVKAGGVLVLFTNDKGNAEFEHFNALAAHFGIHFNEDSHHRVVGKDFEKGKTDRFPAHPIFRDVKQIYTKEVASQQLTKPAEALLTENDLILMAVSAFGKGTVVAVGDPWLYNEYFDDRKLPPEYENWKAAKNLFQWLLEKTSGNSHSEIR
ncbi:MAG: GDSL-type esterase/lipase family protein [bacterium]